MIDGSKAEHSYNKQIATDAYKVSDATCTAKATYYMSCECGAKGTETFESGEVNASNHSWGHPTYTWNATEGGYTCTAERVCGNDATHKETETITATYSVTTAPTCTNKGEGTYTATFTNSAFTQQTKTVEIAAADHSLVDVPEVPATYEADGVKAHQHCSVCGKNFINDVEKTDEELRIPKLTRPSGGGNTSNVITVENTKNGDVTSSHKSAAKGTTVTLTVEPDKGYTLETLTVTDKNGNEIELTAKGDASSPSKCPPARSP